VLLFLEFLIKKSRVYSSEQTQCQIFRLLPAGCELKDTFSPLYETIKNKLMQ
jgi:hypothetical protein